MKCLLIKQCPDALMWYADLVGVLVPYLGKWPEGYMSREDDGHLNIVRFEDADLVEITVQVGTAPHC